MSEKEVVSGRRNLSNPVNSVYITTDTSFDSMMRWSDVTRRRRSTRAVATIARSAVRFTISTVAP